MKIKKKSHKFLKEPKDNSLKKFLRHLMIKNFFKLKIKNA